MYSSSAEDWGDQEGFIYPSSKHCAGNHWRADTQMCSLKLMTLQERVNLLSQQLNHSAGKVGVKILVLWFCTWIPLAALENYGAACLAVPAGVSNAPHTFWPALEPGDGGGRVHMNSWGWVSPGTHFHTAGFCCRVCWDFTIIIAASVMGIPFLL